MPRTERGDQVITNVPINFDRFEFVIAAEFEALQRCNMSSARMSA
jgi:hypothetical protein